MKHLCIYHANCADGFGAAWAVRAALGDSVEFYPGTYQSPPPDVCGRTVILVDFSYKRPVLDQMARDAQSILILDHHKSAAEDLAGLPEPPPLGPDMRGWMPESGVFARFDMAHSGARLAWDHFHAAPPPRLIAHIEDRDLWRFSLPGTREIQAAIFSHPYDFHAWDELMCSFDFAGDSILLREGAAIERKHHKDVAELVQVCRRRMNIGGYDVWVASLPYTLASDAAHLMANGEPFSGCYWDTSEYRIFGLRSNDDGIDVAEVAVRYGGGGHRNAAGFSVPRNHVLAMS